MKRSIYTLIAVSLILQTGCRAQPNRETSSAGVRPAAVAGKFYPDDPEKLRLAVSSFLEDALTTQVERPIAIVAPHAGYIYSGQVAADAFKPAGQYKYDLVVILGTNHTTPGFTKVSVYPKGGFASPLGVVAIDESAAAELLRLSKDCTADLSVQREEHSVEVQVPFVQVLFPTARILPIVIGEPDPELCDRLGKALAEVLKDRNTLIVASSDLSHYPRYDDALSVDCRTLKAVATLDPASVHDAVNHSMSLGIRQLSTCACGEGPIMTAMVAAKALGATRGVVISYASSGMTALGDLSRVVGYGAVMFTRGGEPSDTHVLDQRPESPPQTTELSFDDRETLLWFARETIRRYLQTGVTPLARGFGPTLLAKRGVFVTLNENGELRGCIGHMAEDLPLCQAVGAMAFAAAFEDRRFQPVEFDELHHIEIEISVLTPLQPVSGPDQIVLGRDGVVIRKSGRSAVFLPQVAPEQGWSRDEMLDHLCVKAGLPEGSWQQGAEFLTFQAVVIKESDIKHLPMRR